MKLFNVDQIRAWDKYTIDKEPIESIDLMERAANQLCYWITKRYDTDTAFLIIAGPGNNGGDALALARMLAKKEYYKIIVVLCKIGPKLSPDCEINLYRLTKQDRTKIIELNPNDTLPTIDQDQIVVDGLFGSGLSRPVEGYWAKLIEHINEKAKEIIAIDIPSGLFADKNSTSLSKTIIKANNTLSFQVPKLAFLMAENYKHIKNWHVLNIGLLDAYRKTEASKIHLLQQDDVKRLLQTRKPFDHKGTFGHAFLIAGAYQKTGAAILAAKACLRSGVGLLTIHVPESAYTIMQTAVPEAMLFIDESEMKYCDTEMQKQFSAYGMGPGIGRKSSMQEALQKLMENNQAPLVLDADALNILADNPELLKKLPEHSILTPHPGEFDRLTKKHNSSEERWCTQIEFAKKHHIVVVLKGAYTSIVSPEGETWFNPTGNPGMATAGSGDVLTGIILSLLAQKYEPLNAAKVGVYMHGLAGDLATNTLGQEALIASDMISHLGPAFIKIKKDNE
jgi:NAD(P)H-hydrate epimerase